eukprot:15480192-Alexandrium_andersonii.AAC.1
MLIGLLACQVSTQLCAGALRIQAQTKYPNDAPMSALAIVCPFRTKSACGVWLHTASFGRCSVSSIGRRTFPAQNVG